MTNADKRTVSTDALETLGTILGDGEKRDAIHLAVLPVIAGGRLKPGQGISLVDGLAVADKNGIAIVDPFLPKAAMPGERFWMVLRPRLVKSLRHVWSHPAFPDEALAASPDPGADLAEAQAWAVIEAEAEHAGIERDEIVDAARYYIKSGEYLSQGGRWEGHSMLDEEKFWSAYEVVTGEKVEENDRGSFFSCSC